MALKRSEGDVSQLHYRFYKIETYREDPHPACFYFASYSLQDLKRYVGSEREKDSLLTLLTLNPFTLEEITQREVPFTLPSVSGRSLTYVLGSKLHSSFQLDREMRDREYLEETHPSL